MIIIIGTELLINELIKYNKPFQMLAYPNRSHSISEVYNNNYNNNKILLLLGS